MSTFPISFLPKTSLFEKKFFFAPPSSRTVKIILIAAAIFTLIGIIYYYFTSQKTKKKEKSIDLEAVNQLSVLQLRFECADKLLSKSPLTEAREKWVLATIFLPLASSPKPDQIQTSYRKIRENLLPLLLTSKKKEEASSALERLDHTYLRLSALQ